MKPKKLFRIYRVEVTERHGSPWKRRFKREYVGTTMACSEDEAIGNVVFRRDMVPTGYPFAEWSNDGYHEMHYEAVSAHGHP